MTDHGPMAMEVMVRRGLDVDVEGWLDRYVRRLAMPPGTGAAIRPGEWRAALGQAPHGLAFWAARYRETAPAAPSCSPRPCTSAN